MRELHAFIARGTDAGIWGLTPRLDSPDTRVVVFLLSLEVMLKLGFGSQTRWWRSIFPAYAGVFPHLHVHRVDRCNLPRIRGGVPVLAAGKGCDLQIFPAYAGVFPSKHAGGALLFYLPRIRGGVPRSRSDSDRSRVIFPAYAGVFLPHHPLSYRVPHLPRIRGGVSQGKRNPTEPTVFPAYAGVFLGQVLSR